MLEGAGLSFALRQSDPVPQTDNPFVDGWQYSKANTKTIPRTEWWQRPAPSGLGAVPASNRQFLSTYGGIPLENGWDQPIPGRDKPAPYWAWEGFKDNQEQFEYETRFLGPTNKQEAIQMHWCFRVQAPPPRCDIIPQVVAVEGSNQVNF